MSLDRLIPRQEPSLSESWTCWILRFPDRCDLQAVGRCSAGCTMCNTLLQPAVPPVPHSRNELLSLPGWELWPQCIHCSSFFWSSHLKAMLLQRLSFYPSLPILLLSVRLFFHADCTSADCTKPPFSQILASPCMLTYPRIISGHLLNLLFKTLKVWYEVQAPPRAFLMLPPRLPGSSCSFTQYTLPLPVPVSWLLLHLNLISFLLS